MKVIQRNEEQEAADDCALEAANMLIDLGCAAPMVIKSFENVIKTIRLYKKRPLIDSEISKIIS